METGLTGWRASVIDAISHRRTWGRSWVVVWHLGIVIVDDMIISFWFCGWGSIGHAIRKSLMKNEVKSRTLSLLKRINRENREEGWRRNQALSGVSRGHTHQLAATMSSAGSRTPNIDPEGQSPSRSSVDSSFVPNTGSAARDYCSKSCLFQKSGQIYH